MANIKVDLNKLRDEIASEKSRVRGVPQRLGEATGNYAAPKDEFLNGLIVSLKTGQQTPASKLLKEVDIVAEQKVGGKVKSRLPIGNNQQQDEYYHPNQQKPRTPMVIGESADREEQMFLDLERRKKQTLAEALSDGLGIPANQMQMQPRYAGQPINEQALVENVRGVVNGYLAENLMPILEESTRSVIIEMYAAEKLKTVLKENKDLIKSYVIEVIRELQAKSKPKV